MTRPAGRSLAAVALAAVLGVSGGAVTALWMHEEEIVDPLLLGVPMENLECDETQAIVVVGTGDSATALRHSVADWGDDGMRYLRPSESCQTAYPADEDGDVPEYLAYLSGYPTVEAACEDRMSSEHKDDLVTLLREGNTDAVMCPCEMDRTSLPSIGEGAEITTETGMWTFMYQRMMVKAGLMRADQVTSEFDDLTIRKTRRLQTANDLNAFGRVDTDTWVVLRDLVCARYDN